VAASLVASRAVLSSTELVIIIIIINFELQMGFTQSAHKATQTMNDISHSMNAM
jgi:hypothetical protein